MTPPKPPNPKKIVLPTQTKHRTVQLHSASGQAASNSYGIRIVHETPTWLIVSKPALLDSQNSRPDRPSVAQFLEERYGYRGLVHRLDFGTSGLLLCAKTSAAAHDFSVLLQNHKIERTYVALIMGVPNASIVGAPITLPIDDKPASTRFQILQKFANATLVRVDLETGRKHQIRRHFSEIGHPLLGEVLYKKKGSQLMWYRPALHAEKLQFNYEGSQTFNDPLPADFQELLKKLPQPPKT